MIPDEILQMEGIEDYSWHNDTCPSFGLYDDLGTHLRIYVEHPDPDKREYGPDAERFCVMFSDDDDHDRCNGVVLCMTNDVSAAVRAFMEGLPEYHATTRAKVGA
jgi:hypothetical protein